MSAMASPSITPATAAADDEEGFDWEAAVREIDTACEIAAASSASNGENLSRPIAAAKPKQSTLDRFVDSFQKKSSSKDSSFRTPAVRDNVDVNGGDEQVPEVKIDLEAAKTWIYPLNVPKRDYQFNITKTALFSNTLVALPTGLGKTLIAAVVMFNYFRWFPEGKIVFAAPSRPLVMQQIEACHNIVGIPQDWTIDMTGQMSPPKRSIFWKSKSVFFVTPQVLEKDIQSGICPVRCMVCLVIDEAHRATGNYSYCVAVRELMAVPVQLRILALTATPGSKQHAVQNVIDNLCISTLEYRSENDRDVSQYVHDRKLELIQVSMGKNAIEINSLLLEAIQPYVARLCAMGVLYNRDFATMSPCEFLNSRDKFRQAPPLNLPPAKYGEVECYFGALITLYHIRKLLSSHGVSPAHEMLDDKLKQGSFARLMSGNEKMQKAKLLMNQSLTDGSSNPKLVKMMEILIDHFKAKDPRDSRVIIFSNFRGSVKDIMKALTNMSGLVKATEFIGQSSGKALKGQSQKMQQAVLQKFRTGGYNVIVATSIGEEGLDIMEVDLVICFDANVSPLRMIQRMGRTGRKHDGRVVILACEGSELKGYLKKQASSKAVKKHMHNGGHKSFNFHASPRMVPHICKPEVQLVELSIEKYVPRGRKVKEDPSRDSLCPEKLSNEETALLAKYFQPSGDSWIPSLIAFPCFQSYPSRIHKVRHSFRTTSMLIDTLQHLQELWCPKARKDSYVDEDFRQSRGIDVGCDDDCEKASTIKEAAGDIPQAEFEENVYAGYGSPIAKNDEPVTADHPVQKPSDHHFLFGETFVTLNSFSSVLIASVPTLPFIKDKILMVDLSETLSKEVCSSDCSLKSAEVDNGNALKDQNDVDIEIFSYSRNTQCIGEMAPVTPKSGSQIRHEGENPWLQKPICGQMILDPTNRAIVLPHVCEHTVSALEAGQSDDKSKHLELRPDSSGDEYEDKVSQMELSPRLTHFIEDGIVPESPALEINRNPSESGNAAFVCFPPENENCGSQTSGHVKPANIENVMVGAAACSALVGYEWKDSLTSGCALPNMTVSPGIVLKTEMSIYENTIRNAQYSTPDIERRESLLGSSVSKGPHTPIAQEPSSFSEEWQVKSADLARSITQSPKYKRLRRYKDIGKLPCKTLREKFESFIEDTRETIRSKSNQAERQRGKSKKAKQLPTILVDEEAEVSQDHKVSDDEEEENEDVYDDSFIDDRTNPSEASTQGKNSAEMIAFYRHSLISQSPLDASRYLPKTWEYISPQMTKSSSSSFEVRSGSCETPQDDSTSIKGDAETDTVNWSSHLERVRLRADLSACGSASSNKLGNRKRKLSYLQGVSIPETDVLQEDSLHENHSENPPICRKPEITAQSTIYSHEGLSCDDDFYQGLDLDKLEAQATELLKNKSGMSLGSQTFANRPPEVAANPGLKLMGSPSFDLGV